MKRTLAAAFVALLLAGAAAASPADPELPQWREITSATETSDFKLNCEYYAVFEYIPGATRALFLNFIAVGLTGYPGVTSVVTADASGGQNFRVENTEKDRVKFGTTAIPARVYERCHRRLSQ